jgi:mono/diheme cytochrome c family protein
MTIRRWTTILFVAALAACSGNGSDQAADTEAAPPTPPPAEPAEQAPSAEIDAALAAQGESLFQTKACVGCHTVGGGPLAGPDLAGVTERRTAEWVIAMISNPDSMLREDETARQLMAEFAIPMANTGVTTGEARAIYEFLRRGGE